MDVMELPTTSSGNKYVIVLQDFLTKWPMVFAAPDQKASRITQLLAEEVVPFCGVPEALLSDRGTNLLSHLVQDVCNLLGIKKLNTTSYHPQCDGMVERLNRTLKTMIRKHIAQFGPQWDTYLSGPIGTPSINRQVRSPRSFCSGSIVEHRLRLHCCRHTLWIQLM